MAIWLSFFFRKGNTCSCLSYYAKNSQKTIDFSQSMNGTIAIFASYDFKIL